MLAIKNLKIHYEGDESIIQDFDLNLQSGMILAMLGDSGSGKTSVLRAIAGLCNIADGVISLDGVILSHYKMRKYVAIELRDVGMVFQDCALFPHLTVATNIGFGLKYFNYRIRKKRIRELLALIGLPHSEKKYPHQLSAGEQQRVALARSLAPKPKLLLLDEPFSNLDVNRKNQLVAQVRSILKQEGMTAIFVTHNEKEAKMLADDIAYIKDKKLHVIPADKTSSIKNEALHMFT